MKPRRPWLRKFASWFFNASPEWQPPEHDASTPPPAHDAPAAVAPMQARQAQQGDAPADAGPPASPIGGPPQQD